MAHGGTSRTARTRTCKHEDGCEKDAKKGGFCMAHGGTSRTHTCKHEDGCEKQSQGKGGFCIAHGGTGSKCKHESGCDKQPRGKGGFCVAHGGTEAPRKRQRTPAALSDFEVATGRLLGDTSGKRVMREYNSNFVPDVLNGNDENAFPPAPKKRRQARRPRQAPLSPSAFDPANFLPPAHPTAASLTLDVFAEAEEPEALTAEDAAAALAVADEMLEGFDWEGPAISAYIVPPAQAVAILGNTSGKRALKESLKWKV